MMESENIAAIKGTYNANKDIWFNFIHFIKQQKHFLQNATFASL